MKKKSLIIYSALWLFLICAVVGVIVIPNVMAKPTEKHTHDYALLVDNVVDNNKAYHIKKCSCGETSRVEMTNYVVATTETAQTVFDTIEDGKTIVLDEGEYGNLYFRKNDNSVNIPSDWAGGAAATFKREIKDITILGTEGTQVASIIAEAGTYVPGGNEHSLSETVNYLNMYISFENLTIKNITFNPEAKKCAVELASAGQKVSINGLTIDGCAVNGAGDLTSGNRLFQSENQLATAYSSLGEAIFNAERKNIAITNNVLNNLHQGVKINFVENLVISGNQFNGIKGRDILMSGGNMEGVITISNNISNGSTERFIRMTNLVGTLNITNNVITNNTFHLTNEIDIVKITNTTGTINVQGNSWNGNDDLIAKEAGILNY